MISNHYSPNNMAYRVIAILLIIGLVLCSILTPVVQATAGMEIINSSMGRDITRASGVLPGIASGIAETNNGDSTYNQVSSDLSPDTGSDWLARVQEDIRQSEYHITWQEHTYLSDVEAAYQAPNRAHNLRTYFTPQGVRLMTRTSGGDSPAWEMGLTLSGYGIEGEVLSADTTSLRVKDQRIEYNHAGIIEWYQNDVYGLHQGFTISTPLNQEGIPGEWGLLELEVSGDLAPNPAREGVSIEFGAADRMGILHLSGLEVYDSTGRSLNSYIQIAEHSIIDKLYTMRIFFDVSAASYPITLSQSMTAETWTYESNQAGAEFGISVATAGDVNDDSYSDVIIGAHLYDNGQVDEGRVYVFLGNALGLNSDPAWIAESDQEEAFYGVSVGSAGDVNGDGCSDVIIGAPGYDGNHVDGGRAYVYLGSTLGLSITADWIAAGNQSFANFGQSVGTAGDVNDDNYSDVIIGAPFYNDQEIDEGRVFVYHGGEGGLAADPAWSAQTDQEHSKLGWSVGTAGDVNGDGFSDVIVSAPDYDNTESDAGISFVYLGGDFGLAASPDWQVEGDQDIAYLGWSVGTAGDVNGDGFDDVIVGMPGYDIVGVNEGRAYLFLGSTDGLSVEPDWMAQGDQQNGVFGRSVGTSGDVNGDGYSDVIIGAPGYDNDLLSEGRAYVFQGGENGLSSNPEWIEEGDQSYAHFGISVATAGDVNNDGFGDVIVGAYQYDNGDDDEGCVYLYLSASDGLNLPPLADAGFDQIVFTGALVTLDGNDSADPDTDYPLSYLWAQIGGPEIILSDPTVVTPTFTAPADPAILTFTLTVTDSLGLTDPSPDEVVITVINQPPVADAGPDQYVDTGVIVTLDSSGSSDPDGDYPLSYLWEQIGVPTVTLSDPFAVAPTFTAPSDPSVLTFTLTVTDSLDKIDPTPDDVVITVINQPPVADAGSDQSVSTASIVTLDGSGSSDPDGDYPLTYLWTQISGSIVTLSDPTSVNPTFMAPSEPVVLIFTLTVTDSLAMADPTPDEVRIMIGGILGYDMYLPVAMR